MTVIDPRGERAETGAHTSANRLETLEGIHIGVLENHKTNARELLTTVAEILQRDHKVGSYEVAHKAVFSQPAPADVLEGLAARSRMILTGIGD